EIPGSVTSKEIFGIFGIIHLISCPYLIIITGRSRIGDINGETIWKINKLEVLSFRRGTYHLNEEQQNINKHYVSLLEYACSMEGLYFSYTYDITHTLQRLQKTSPEFKSMALYERADHRFVWNLHALRDLMAQPDLQQYILPVMCGFVFIKTCTIKRYSVDMILISRRNIFRVGTRYFTRGIDEDGNVANNVETEQAIIYNGNKSSFVQIRGSIPLFWKQRPNLKYKLKPEVMADADHVCPASRHFDQQILQYGHQTLIDLINQTGSEQSLGIAYKGVVEQINYKEVRYEAFDFHHECKNMKYEKLSILLDRLESDRVRYGYFMVRNDGSVVSAQTGAFRTNCIDCLDRTNVVQSMLAHLSVQDQLQRLGILSSGEKLSDQKEFQNVYMNAWADNANTVSTQYSGTGALKTDFTRTGKRTVAGAFNDFVNSATRYYKNNFTDGFRLDSLALLLGTYNVNVREGIDFPSPLKKGQRRRLLPLIILFCLSMLMISLVIPETNLQLQFGYVLFWGVGVLVTLGFMFRSGTDFVNMPSLVSV
ncbi:uncharacterized protein TRIADDRAFT_24656, partial [Trichoplax adhaerens]